MGKHTVCRLEERKHPATKRPAIEFIDDIFNPVERIENQISGLEKKVERIVQWLEGNNNNALSKS